MDKIQIAGIVAGILTSVSSIPQLVKIFKEKEVEDLSIGMILFLICGIGTWIYYGILRNDWPIIITNLFSLLVNLTFLIFYKFYKKQTIV